MSDKDTTYFQHGLVLAEGVAYQNMVGVDPKNSDAKTDGLKRVKAFASLESLLYHKLSPSASHHSGPAVWESDAVGRNLLSDGQIEFVRRWIEAGAPKTGTVADAALLDDKTVTTVAYEPLTVPAAGTGFQMAVPAFDIQPNFERELFTRRMVGNTQDVYVNRYETKMRSGSHHFVAYDFQKQNVYCPI